ncbi:holo-ACP synthase, partial [Tessaracoccus terricola]
MPIHGVGVDIVDVARVARLLARGGSFTHRWFSDEESARCGTAADPARAYSMTLAAKEAAWKSLGLGWEAGVPWRSVLVAADGTVRLDGAVAGAARAAGVG